MGFARSGRCLLIVPMALAGSLAHAADDVPAPPCGRSSRRRRCPRGAARRRSHHAGRSRPGSITIPSLSSYPDENGAYLRGVLQRGKRNTWSAELVQQSEFGDRGVFDSLPEHAHDQSRLVHAP